MGLDTHLALKSYAGRVTVEGLISTSGEEDQQVVWWRYIGAVRRGSSLVYWAELEDRTVASAKGGGGKINQEEMTTL